MSKNDFEKVRPKISDGPKDSVDKSFHGFRGLQEYFNENILNCFTAGSDLVVDESTSGWKGVDEKRYNGPPWLCHLKNKPQPVSFMLKTMADCDTGVIIKIELQEGKEEMKLKRFSDTMKPSTAVVRRLLEDYEGSGRTIFGDSWFTNMNTIEMVRSIGNFYVGMVKTGHAGIPKQYMNTMAFNGPDAKRGDHMTLHLGNDSQRIICVG